MKTLYAHASSPFKVVSLLVLALLLHLTSFTLLQANNLQLADVNVNLGAKTVTFNISWDNSWRYAPGIPPGNHDAVWVFLKYQDCTQEQLGFTHLDLAVGGHSIGAGLEIVEVSDKKGVFIRRNNNGSGNISATSVTLRYEPTLVPVGGIEVRVFGIEMVFVTEGDFYLGDNSGTTETGVVLPNDPLAVSSGTITTSGFREGPSYPMPRAHSPANRAFKVTNAHENISGLPIGNNVGQLWVHGWGDWDYYGIPFNGSVSVPVNYPLGYNSYYIMKYECSQGQYVDFLNTLSNQQMHVRRPVPTGVDIPFMVISGTHPEFVASFPDRAAGFLSWGDQLAYLDWAALRPMTESEYEKACRGPQPGVPGEFAWGDPYMDKITGYHTVTFLNENTASETLDAPFGVGIARVPMVENSVGGIRPLPRRPARVGHRGGPGTNRLESTTSYYGVHELTGNLHERAISLLPIQGPPNWGWHSSFDGNVHGDGNLNPATSGNLVANHDVANWPNLDPTVNFRVYSIKGYGLGFSGGSWSDHRVSTRGMMSTIGSTLPNSRDLTPAGIRGVRTFPTP